MYISREQLERWQVVVYGAAIGLGAGIGLLSPLTAPALSSALWPLLAMLLFVTFLQVPFANFGGVFRHRAFLAALLVGNFLAVPLLVWGLSIFLPLNPEVRLGFFLVLLVPCTDWFLTFTVIGRGDGRLAIASTPLLLLMQMALLPLYLWLFLGSEATTGMQGEPFLRAFALIIVLPLSLAFVVERVALRSVRVAQLAGKSGVLPVPLLAAVMFVIAASEVQGVVEFSHELFHVVALFVVYLLLVMPLGLALSKVGRLEGAATRTLIFSLGTRNSFVVLPLVLAWPGAGALAVAVVVIQSLVELVGMLVYLMIVPRLGMSAKK